MISGEITLYQPAVIPAGQPLDIFVSFNAYNEGGIAWNTRITASAGTMADSDTQNHPLEKGHRDAEKLSLGVMPNRVVTGTIKLEARPYSPYGWIGIAGWDTLDYKSFTISPAVKEAVIAPKLPPVDRPAWPGFVDTRYVSPTDPTTSTFEFPWKTEVPATPEEKKTWLWVGLAVVGIITVGLLVK